MKPIFIVSGSLLGLLIVRVFLLDTLELIGWHAIWDHVGKGGSLSSNDVDMIIHSSTFAKCITGMLLGGLLGVLVFRAGGKRSDKSTPDGDVSTKKFPYYNYIVIAVGFVVLLTLFLGYRWNKYNQCQRNCDRNCMAENRGQAFGGLGMSLCRDSVRACRESCSFP